MSMRCYIICLFLVAVSFSGFGQMFKTEMDTTYIRLYPHTIKVKGIFLDRYYGLRLKEKGIDRAVKMSAREQSYFGLGITIWNLNLDFSSLIANPLEKKKIGEEDGFDLQLSLYTRRWNFDAELSNIKNFSFKNKDVFDNIDEEIPDFNNLNIRRIELGATYIFLPEKFSFRSAFIQVDRQLKSAGSPILSFTYKYSSLDSDSIPTPESIEVPTLEKLKSEGHKFALLPGYSYNFNHKAWFVNTTGSVGFDIQKSSFSINDEADDNLRLEWLFELKGGLGYHDDTYSAGALIFYQFSPSRLDELRLWTNSGSLRLFFAYRFPAPKFVRKTKPKFLD